VIEMPSIKKKEYKKNLFSRKIKNYRFVTATVKQLIKFTIMSFLQ
jgi:hypothetical protein